MKNKLYIYIEETPYRKGVERYLALTKGGNGSLELIDNPAKIKPGEKAILLTDSKRSELLKLHHLIIYQLTTETDETYEDNNKICKFNSFDNIIDLVLSREEDNEGREREFKLICLSSIRQGAGKTTVALELAKILAQSRKTALIQIYPSRETTTYSARLDELMLSSMNGNRLVMDAGEEALYSIAPFKLIEDYTELDIKNFHRLLRELNEEKHIEYFIMEARHYLDRTSRELIGLADINLVVLDEEEEDLPSEIAYLKGLSSKDTIFRLLKNKVRRLRNEDELPYVYGLEKGDVEPDLRHFSSLLRRIVEGL